MHYRTKKEFFIRIVIGCLLFLLLAPSSAMGSKLSKTQVSLELGGAGLIYSVFGSYRPVEKFAVNLGISYLSINGPDSILLPFSGSLLLGGHGSYLEILGGAIFATSADPTGFYLPQLGLGYRLWPTAGGFHFPFTPTSHPFVERLIGTIRREFTDHILFWNKKDLQRKLESYQQYFNRARVHQGLQGSTPITIYNNRKPKPVDGGDLSWQNFCQGLFNVPIAA